VPNGGAGGVDAGPVATGGQPSGGGPSAGGLPCAVKTILDTKCATCHGATPSFGAPMALTTAAQFQAAGASDKTKKVYQLVKTRINSSMPNVRMPPTSSTALTPAELTTFNTWLDQNAQASTETCAAPSGGGGTAVGGGGKIPIDRTGYECFKFLAHAEGNKNAPFPVGIAVDQYYAFGFKAPWSGTVYGEIFAPVIDNSQAIHHWLFYEEPTQDGSISGTIGQHAQGRMLAGWAPGGDDYNFKEYGDVGFELPATSYILELHYNSSVANAVDASGMEICIQKNKPEHVAGLSWLGYDQGAVLAATTGVCNPADTWTGTCVPQSREPIHVLFVTPHLHQTGRHLKSVINGPSGQRVLLDEPFDFNYQRSYKSAELIMPGETITTTCTFSEPQCFGQATAAEMCYLFTYAWPKGALVDGADWGALAHGEGTCLGQTTLDVF
jgi:hypothetical protein